MISKIYQTLDYCALGTIYCDEGGEAFWTDRHEASQRLGIKLATVLKNRLQLGGRSLYVGAGVAEIPMLVIETQELNRDVSAFNLRMAEVTILNEGCKSLPFTFYCAEAQTAAGHFDHIWMVSVFNDPERFPELSALGYGRANPATFNPYIFAQEREIVMSMTNDCLKKLTLPGLVTTSVEETPWIKQWCEANKIPFVIEKEDYPTAIVGDPVCFIRVG